MKAISWVRWIFAACVCASVLSTTLARQKFRHPQPQIYKKSWPVGPRISMGNSVHMNSRPSNYKHNRPMQHKPTNYRYPAPNPARRPPMFAVLPSWKTQSVMGPPSNQGSLPQRGPIKEFHSMNKVAEYRPEQSIPVPTNRGNIDDDKGPIHTIPAPNLSPADKPYNIPQQNNYQQNSEYTQTFLGSPQSSATNYVFGTQGTSLAPQRITTGQTSPSPTLNRYEVTETNEIGVQDYRTSVQPNFFTPDFDVTRLSNFATTGGQTIDGFGNHPSGSNSGLIGTTLQFGQQNSQPMQTNLHSSLHVGFPASALQAQQNSAGDQLSPDLHVGHPAPAGPPLSANQLYDLLNSFPQQFNDQYNGGQQQQQQQQVLQQQLDQLFQPATDTQFSQPQMQSFNYDEQSNKQQQQQQQQQQQIFVGQDYASGRVTADYSLEPDTRESLRKTNNPARQESSGVLGNAGDNLENNIEYVESSNRKGLSTYFNQVGDGSGSISSQFYTTLPSRDAAEKLAALAAAGNVNSHLIDQLRKQQGGSKFGASGSMPSNHKDDRYSGAEGDQQHPRYVNRDREEGQNDQNGGSNQAEEEEEEEEEEERPERGEKRPMRIMVPDLEDYTEDLEQRPGRGEGYANRNTKEDYEYDDNEESQLSNVEEDANGRQQATLGNGNQAVYREQLETEFGSRLGPKKSQ